MFQVEIELEIDGVAVCSQLQDINVCYTRVQNAMYVTQGYKMHGQ